MATRLRRIRSKLRPVASQSGLLLAFLLFPLPWIDVQCTGPSNTPAKKLALQCGIPDWVYDRVVPFQATGATIITQSGLEAAFGVCSVVPNAENNDTEAREGFEDEVNAQMNGSWLLFVFPIVLLIGIALAFLMYPGLIRAAIVAVISLTALLLVFAQLSIGFPLGAWYREECRKEAERVPQLAASLKGKQSRDYGLDLQYTPWFTLTLVGLGGSLFFAWKEWCHCARKPHRDSQDGHGHESPQSLNVDTSPR